MTKPSIRLLMLQRQLEKLGKTKELEGQKTTEKLLTNTPEALLYAVKHELLPLNSASRSSEFSDSILSAHQSKVSPKLAQFVSSIQNNFTVVGVTTLLLAGFFFSHMLLSSTTNSPAAQAQVRLVPTTLTDTQADPLGLEKAYSASVANLPVTQLYQSIDPQKQVFVHIQDKAFDIGAQGDFSHLSYSVLPGQKGHSFFVSSNTSPKVLLDALTPGSRITVTSEGKTYSAVFVSSASWKKGDDTILTNTQKSVITLFLPSDDTTYTMYQLRLTGLES